MRVEALGGVDAQTMRRTMCMFATGVAVVSTETEQGLFGMTVSSLTSVSLEPPQLLVCLANSARTTRAVRERGEFTVSILGQRQDAIASRFARRGDDRFGGLDLHRTERGLPYVPKCLALSECVVTDIITAGDHDIVLARVVSCASREGAPLVFFASGYHDVAEQGRPADWYW
jgi:flavin reductase (DIM6/NTAB) family NADH-FMN oxidoreductase RutF